MVNFTVKEASEKLGISVRAVRKRCEKNKVFRKNGSYSISAEIVLEWKTELIAKAEALYLKNSVSELKKNTDAELIPQTSPAAPKIELDSSTKGTDTDVKGTDTEELQNQYDALQLIAREQKNRIDVLEESAKHYQDKIKELEDELELFQISDDERIEVFSKADYIQFERRLREWHTLQQDLNHKEELHAVQTKSLEDVLSHYKEQWKYQKEQSTKILEMHQTLIDTIQKQSTISIQRNIIEASEKEVIDQDLKPYQKWQQE
jgi:hypothetical protein